MAVFEELQGSGTWVIKYNSKNEKVAAMLHSEMAELSFKVSLEPGDSYELLKDGKSVLSGNDLSLRNLELKLGRFPDMPDKAGPIDQ